MSGSAAGRSDHPPERSETTGLVGSWDARAGFALSPTLQAANEIAEVATMWAGPVVEIRRGGSSGVGDGDDGDDGDDVVVVVVVVVQGRLDRTPNTWADFHTLYSSAALFPRVVSAHDWHEEVGINSKTKAV